MRYFTLKFGQVNVNSLMNKMYCLVDLVGACALDIVAVSETWLTASVPSSFVLLEGFDVVRGDTDSLVRKHGVCLFVRRGLHFVEHSLDCPNVAAIHLLDVDIWVLAVYRPPSYDEACNSRLIQLILTFCADREVVVLGDFNLPSLAWPLENALDVYVRPVDMSFLDCFLSVGLTQWVSESTFLASGSILDLFLTSELDRVGSVDVLSPFPRCMHSPVVCDYLFHVDLGRDVDSFHRGRYLWHRGNYDAISRSLFDVDWQLEFMYLSVNNCFLHLVSLLVRLVDLYVPIRSGAQCVPWSVHPPQQLMRERSLAWQDFKRVRASFGRVDPRSVLAMGVFNTLNHQYRTYAIRSRAQYEEHLMDRFCESPKLFHSYIRNKKKGRLSVGPLRVAGGEYVVSPQVMTEAFVDAFASAFVGGAPPNPAPVQVFHGQMPDLVVTRAQVLDVLLALDVSSAMGPDGLHPELLRGCAGVLSKPLLILFERSLLCGVLPDLWLESIVIPLFKGKSRYDPLNYRPVSLTSVCCKSLERIIVSCLVEYLESNEILSPHQFGFRKSRSTGDQLLLAYSDVSDWVDDGFVVDVVLLDFSKAFDVVSHDVLILKLRELGVGAVLLDWIRSFLVGRSMRVAVDGCCSGSREVVSGVPQGSVLGPVLFLIYVNHITNGVLSSFKSFADDYKLYLRYRRVKESAVAGVSCLQSDLDRVSAVAASWNLRLNADKCVVLRFARGFAEWSEEDPLAQYYLSGIPLKFVQSHRDLGVVVDVKLKFHHHVREVVGKASGLANNLLRSTICRSPHFMVSLFVMHIRPIMDYCSSVWNVGFLGDLRLLESVQRRWTKSVDGLAELDYSSRLKQLGLFSIKGRFLRADLIKYWRIIRELDGGAYLGGLFRRAPDARTRGHPYKLLMPACNTDIKRRFFGARCVLLWNSLPTCVVESDSLATFKRLLAEFLGDVLFEFV